MSTIDYTNYSIENLLDAKANIDKEAYPENYAALMNEFETRNFDTESYNKYQQERKLKSAEKRVKLIGVFQLLAVIVIPLYMLLLNSNGHSFNIAVYIITLIFVSFNAVAGWTAFKGLKKYYWLSILNQSLQLFSFAAGSILVNYSGIGGMYTLIKWGNNPGFEFSATFNPGFNFIIFEVPLPSGYIAIDIMAIIFIAALVTVYNKEPQLTRQ